VKKSIFNYYNQLYAYIAHNRIIKKDLDERYIHSHLACTLATGFLMWAYALVAYLTISSPVPWIVGLLASIVHALSPLLYRVNNNRNLNTNILLGSGICHQSAFAFYCGGFSSNVIIWFGLLPILAGLLRGRRGVIVWTVVCSTVTALFLVLKLEGYSFPNLISPVGLLFSQALITFGWIYAGAVIVWVFLFLEEDHEIVLESKKTGIQNLLWIIIHDISNPLSVVIGRSEMLLDSNLAQNDLASVQKVSNNATNIGKIIENVRDLYSMELGKTRIVLTDVNLVELLHTLKESFSDKLAKKRIKLNLIHSDVPHILRTSADLLLNQILGNLLSNAIKFSEVNSEIAVHLSKTKDSIVISVKDNGIGIPEDLQLKLFEIAEKTNRKGTDGESGSGFGLPIVKAYVEKLNGNIRVESVEASELNNNHGTTFILEFPKF